jgi:hypothetical protein
VNDTGPHREREVARRLIAPCCTWDPEKREVVDVDIGAIIRDLILFDTLILHSIQLKEFPYLIAAFGTQGVAALLKSGRLRVHCQSVTIGQSGQTTMLRTKGGVLPLGSYSFIAIRGHDREQYIHNCLQELHKANAGQKEIIKLKRQVVDALVPWPEDAGNQAVVQLGTDLRSNSSVVHAAMSLALRNEFGITNLPRPLELRLEEIAEQDFCVQSNLMTLGFDEITIHKMIERALLGLGGLNQRVEEMNTYGAISGFLDRECPLFEDRLGFLLQSIRPGLKQESFERVVEIAGLPEFIPSIDRIDVERLLELLETKECQEFREWIATLGQASDLEIADRVKNLRARLGTILHTRIGRILRFLVTTGTGLTPGAGIVAGPVAGAIDSFLVEWILPGSGIATFVNQMYPSIFQPKS